MSMLDILVLSFFGTFLDNCAYLPIHFRQVCPRWTATGLALLSQVYVSFRVADGQLKFVQVQSNSTPSILMWLLH